MEIVIREITTEHEFYSKCIRLRRELLWHPYYMVTPPNFEREENNSNIYVALHTARQISGCVLITNEPQNKWYRIRQLVVDTTCQGQGIGTKLLKCAENQACQKGAKRVALYAHSDCVLFFEKRGYRRLSGWYAHANGMKTILMVRDLPDE